ncbi:hypothetical protein [Amycolatopsis sp. NPDC004079]|uniref:hypothetical protein n=1 Tax=Amycolatopsis sp. NPDC004079 TaxID=3154549 RepID=UPI0033B8CFDE
MATALVRPWRCIVVPADSRVGSVGAAVHDLTRHLPEPEVLDRCPTCGKDVPWPCRRFYDAAYVVSAAKLRIEDFVPPELHPRLPKPGPRTTPTRPSRAPNEENHRG